MANEEKKPAEGAAVSGAAAAPGKLAPNAQKKGVLLGGGIVALIGLAWALSLVAVLASLMPAWRATIQRRSASYPIRRG